MLEEMLREGEESNNELQKRNGGTGAGTAQSGGKIQASKIDLANDPDSAKIEKLRRQAQVLELYYHSSRTDRRNI